MGKLQFRNKEQEELFEKNKGIAFKIAIDWSKKCEIDEEELKSYALESLCMAAISYDKSKCDRFINYASIVINTNIKRELKRRNTQKRKAEKEIIILDGSEYSAIASSSDDIKYNSLLLSINQILDKFPTIQQEAIKKNIIERRTLNELAEEYKVSMRTVHKWILKGKRELQERLMC